MRKITIILTMVIGLTVAGNARATLFDRGGGLIYDSDQDITWLQNANLAGTVFNWQGAVDWADGLMFGGFSDWRLPITVQPDPTCSNQTGDVPPQGFGTGCTGSEMGHMYYNDLGGVAGQNLTGNLDGVDGAQLLNIQFDYWSGTEFAPNPNNAWAFFFDVGAQGAFDKVSLSLFAWAVRPGDVLAAPISEPSTLMLLGFGLVGLLGVNRRRKRQRHR